MTHPSESESVSANEAKLPRRDWLLMPAIGLLTICIMAVSLESTGAYMFPSLGMGRAKCMVVNDPSTGVRGMPDCVCTIRLPEGQPTEYRFNSCGHRAGMECGPKAPGTYRIVMVGSSYGFGYGTDRERTFAALLPAKLTQLTGHKIELYNEAMNWENPHVVLLRFNDVLAANPDMILWVLGVYDIDNPGDALPEFDQPVVAGKGGAELDKSARRRVIMGRIKRAFANQSIPEAIISVCDQTRSALLLRHFLYESQSLYVRNNLEQEGERQQYLMAELDARWQAQLNQVDGDAASIEARARAAGVPLVVAFVPNRIQAAMISIGEWPAGYDPYKLDAEMRTIVTSHGGTYIDIFPGFQRIPNPEQYYLPVDGHPTAEGHAILSRLLATELTSGAVPALRAATRPQNIQGQ